MGNVLQCVSAVDGYAVATSAPQDKDVLSAVMSPIPSAVDATIILGFTVRTLSAMGYTGGWDFAPAYPPIDPQDNGSHAVYSAQWYVNQLRFWSTRTGNIGSGVTETDSVSTSGGSQGLTLSETVTGGGGTWYRNFDTTQSDFGTILLYGFNPPTTGPFPLLSYNFTSGGTHYTGTVGGTEIVSLLQSLSDYLIGQTLDLTSTLNEQYICNQNGFNGPLYQQTDTSYNYPAHGSPLAFDGSLYPYQHGFQTAAPSETVLTSWLNFPVASINYSVVGNSNFGEISGTATFLGNGAALQNPLLIKQPLNGSPSFTGDVLVQRTIVKPSQDVSYILVEQTFCWGWDGTNPIFPLVLLRQVGSGVLAANTEFEIPQSNGMTWSGPSAMDMPFAGTYSGIQAAIANMAVMFVAESTIEGYAAAVAADTDYTISGSLPAPTVMIITGW